MAELNPERLLGVVNDVITTGDTQSLRRVRVGVLRPRDVASIMLVLKVARRNKGEWKLVNAECLQRMGRAVDLLVVLETALLPALIPYPNDPSLITTLRAYNKEINTNATAAGGEFYTNTQQIVTRLGEYIDTAAEDDPNLEELRALVDPLIDQVKALLDDDITVA